MALKLDGLAVLRAMLAAPEAFPAIQADLAKAAGTLAVKQLKAPKLDVEALRAVREAFGADSFALVVESLKDTELKTIVGRLDKHDPAMKTASGVERRRRLLALAEGEAPAEKPKKAPAAKAPAAKAAPKKPVAPKAPRAAAPAPASAGALDSAAMAAVPPRRRRAQTEG